MQSLPYGERTRTYHKMSMTKPLTNSNTVRGRNPWCCTRLGGPLGPVNESDDLSSIISALTTLKAVYANSHSQNQGPFTVRGFMVAQSVGMHAEEHRRLANRNQVPWHQTSPL